MLLGLCGHITIDEFQCPFWLRHLDHHLDYHGHGEGAPTLWFPFLLLLHQGPCLFKQKCANFPGCDDYVNLIHQSCLVSWLAQQLLLVYFL
jgi:hypothetical protein